MKGVEEGWKESEGKEKGYLGGMEIGEEVRGEMLE